jgi:hypothetical protein
MSIDNKITELFDVLAKQKIEVEQAERESSRKWATNCSLHFNGANPINLAAATQEVVRTSVTQLLINQDYTRKASEILGLPMNNTFNGYSYDSWIEDCKKRIAMLQLRTKKEKLNDLEQRLNAIISPEQRRQMELDAIVKELG